MKNPHAMRRELIRDVHAYVETVAKPDITALGEVLKVPGGKGTVVRTFFGATEAMPVRALSYVVSALRVGQLLPCEQVQIICVNRLGSRLNGVDTGKAHRQTKMLAAMGSLLVESYMPEMSHRVLFAEDEHVELSRHIERSTDVIANDSVLQATLSSKGAKHGGDFTTYAAAHFAYQDTDQLTLSPVVGSTPVQNIGHIVSVGCQQERVFHRFRTSMREAMVDSDESVVTAVQVFTQHVSPPYYMARHGEQLLETALCDGFDIAQTSDRAAQRDLQHLSNFVGEYNETN